MITVSDETVYFNFDPDNQPTGECHIGDRVMFKTRDCFNGQLFSESDQCKEMKMNEMNPCSGPLYIHGAQPGLTLEILIESVSPKGPGILTLVPNEGVLMDYFTQPKTKLVRIENNRTIFAPGIEIENSPHIGTFGTTMIGRIPTGRTGNHGGNMDCPFAKAGTTVYLPIFIKGALLMIGDAHAAMGEGEICIGVECSADVVVQIKGIHDHFIESPIMEDDKYWVTTSDSSNLKDGVLAASKRMVDFLVRKTELTTEDATLLMSVAGDIRLSQVAEAGYNYTFHAAFPKKVFKNGDLNSFRPLRY